MDIRGPSDSIEFVTPKGDFTAEIECSISVKKWFTDVNSVKLMFGTIARNQEIRNEEQILSGTEENFLSFSGLRINSEKIKGLFVNNPDELTISDYDWMSLSESDIRISSSKVFSDDEKKLYAEGIDYEIDYILGRIRMLLPKTEKSDEISVFAGGGEFISEFCIELQVEKKLKVFYEYYKAFVKDTDYSINYKKGKIARIVSGGIISGSRVYCDYEVEANVESELIAEVIDMAHEEILDMIGIEYKGNRDLRLKFAESNIAMQYLLDSATVQTVQKLHSAESARQLSRLGDKYADRFRKQGLKFLMGFLKRSGFISAGKKGKNYSW